MFVVTQNILLIHNILMFVDTQQRFADTQKHFADTQQYFVDTQKLFAHPDVCCYTETFCQISCCNTIPFLLQSRLVIPVLKPSSIALTFMISHAYFSELHTSFPLSFSVHFFLSSFPSE
jgi:hypothetical protein